MRTCEIQYNCSQDNDGTIIRYLVRCRPEDPGAMFAAIHSHASITFWNINLGKMSAAFPNKGGVAVRYTFRDIAAKVCFDTALRQDQDEESDEDSAMSSVSLEHVEQEDQDMENAAMAPCWELNEANCKLWWESQTRKQMFCQFVSLRLPPEPKICILPLSDGLLWPAVWFNCWDDFKGYYKTDNDLTDVNGDVPMVKLLQLERCYDLPENASFVDYIWKDHMSAAISDGVNKPGRFESKQHYFQFLEAMDEMNSLTGTLPAKFIWLGKKLWQAYEPFLEAIK
jgi:hypothetical protein